MNHIFGLILATFSLFSKYIVLAIVFAFDAVIFGVPIFYLYKNIIVKNFLTPELLYFDIVGLIFLFKLITVLWKSVNLIPDAENENEVLKG